MFVVLNPISITPTVTPAPVCVVAEVLLLGLPALYVLVVSFHFIFPLESFDESTEGVGILGVGLEVFPPPPPPPPPPPQLITTVSSANINIFLFFFIVCYIPFYIFDKNSYLSESSSELSYSIYVSAFFIFLFPSNTPPS